MKGPGEENGNPNATVQEANNQLVFAISAQKHVATIEVILKEEKKK